MRKPTPKFHRIPPQELYFYAQSFYRAAKTLAATFQPEASLFAEADASPVIFLYRHALELFLKAIVLGEGGNFLASRPDPISVGKTHSASWLAQLVRQIVTALKWEAEFTCEGVASLGDFKIAVDAVNSVDPGAFLIASPIAGPDWALDVRQFSRKMDALCDLLDSTADALAAEWDLRTRAMGLDWEEHGGGGSGPTVQ